MKRLKCGEDIIKIMKQLVAENGIELLNDVNRVNALLMDLVPHLEKERKIIIMVMREGIISKLLKMTNESKENQSFESDKCIKQLAASILITEEAARYAVGVLANIFEMQVSLTNNLEAIENNKNLNILSKDMGLVSEDAINYALKDCEAIGFKALASNSKVKDIILPSSIKYIYPKAFINCIHLRHIDIPKEIEEIGPCAFEGCASLEKITILEGSNFKVCEGQLISKKDKKLLRVENQADMNEIKILNGVTTICKKAFDYSKVKVVEIPKSVSTIEENAFYLTMNLEKLKVEPKNLNFKDIEGVLYNKKGTILIKYPQAKKETNYYIEDLVEEIGTQAFSYAKNLENVTFMNTMKKIGSKAFEYCLKIENLILPQSIEIIGERAFQYCENMKGIMLSRGIKEIEDYAFFNCYSLENLSIPRNVEKIGHLAFANCKKLRSVIIQDKVSFIGDGAFLGCDEVEVSIKDNEYVENYCNVHKIKCKKI